MEDYMAALSRDSGSGYTTGTDLLWCDSLYSPTPRIPVRTDMIPDLVECYFKTPWAMPHTMYISLNQRPVDKRGALLAINPEEMMHAV
ncbi:MAG: hypothetical protein ACKPKO_57180, partial [Candidatus Fonsibacter sp.]